MLGCHSVGLQAAGRLRRLTVGLGLGDRVLRRARDEVDVGLVEAADTIRLVVDVAGDVFDVLHVRPGGMDQRVRLGCHLVEGFDVLCVCTDP